MRSLRENGPIVLVPAAWSVVLAAHVGTVTERTLLIAHVVMLVLQVVFVAASWSEMSDGVLRIWRTVILVGIPATAAGLAGLLGIGTGIDGVLLGLGIYGWMVLPATGLALTGPRMPEEGRRYLGGAALCGIGVVLYAVEPLFGGRIVALSGIALVGIGQTVGIADAVVRF